MLMMLRRMKCWLWLQRDQGTLSSWLDRYEQGLEWCCRAETVDTGRGISEELPVGCDDSIIQKSCPALGCSQFGTCNYKAILPSLLLSSPLRILEDFSELELQVRAAAHAPHYKCGPATAGGCADSKQLFGDNNSLFGSSREHLASGQC